MGKEEDEGEIEERALTIGDRNVGSEKCPFLSAIKCHSMQLKFNVNALK